jgi:hypothetical protein
MPASLFRTNAASGRFLTPDIDKVRNRSYAGVMNLQVPPELEAKLTRVGAETGRTADQVALDRPRSIASRFSDARAADSIVHRSR